MRKKSYVHGVTSIIYWKRGTHECLDVPCIHLIFERIQMKQYLTNIQKSNTSSDIMEEKVDHWLDFFQKYHKNYTIMPTESFNSSCPENSIYISVIPSPGLINQENETRCYFNATIQLLYWNILFVVLILNINWYNTMISLDKNNKQSVHHYQKIMIGK